MGLIPHHRRRALPHQAPGASAHLWPLGGGRAGISWAHMEQVRLRGRLPPGHTVKPGQGWGSGLCLVTGPGGLLRVLPLPQPCLAWCPGISGINENPEAGARLTGGATLGAAGVAWRLVPPVGLGQRRELTPTLAGRPLLGSSQVCGRAASLVPCGLGWGTVVRSPGQDALQEPALQRSPSGLEEGPGPRWAEQVSSVGLSLCRREGSFNSTWTAVPSAGPMDLGRPGLRVVGGCVWGK